MTPSIPTRGFVASGGAISRDWVSVLAIDLLVAVVEGVDAVRVERLERTHGPRDVDHARRVLAHDGGLDRLPRTLAEREHAVRAHQDGPRAPAGERLDDAAAELLVADQGERTDRDLAAELVGDRGHDAGDRLAAYGPRGGVGAGGVDDPADVRQVAVDVTVSGGVARGCQRPVDGVAVQVADDHGVRRELLVGDAAGLDHHQLVLTAAPQAKLALRRLQTRRH